MISAKRLPCSTMRATAEPGATCGTLPFAAALRRVNRGAVVQCVGKRVQRIGDGLVTHRRNSNCPRRMQRAWRHCRYGDSSEEHRGHAACIRRSTARSRRARPPHCRDETYAAVRAKRRGIVKPTMHRVPRLLSGLLRYPVCAGGMGSVGHAMVSRACSARRIARAARAPIAAWSTVTR